MSAPRVLSAGAGLNGLGLVFAPALPADREVIALQGRAERAGACDAPLPARPALAVTIPSPSLSREGSAATARTRNWAHAEGFVAQRPPTDQRYDSRWRASRNSRGAFRSPR